MLLTLVSFISIALSFQAASAQVAYANDFVDPDYVLQKNFGLHTYAAQQEVISWAGKLAVKGPWTVTSKRGTPPSGTKHDYLSWAPYWWPDCSNVGNTTALTPEQIWETCPYRSRDGQFNPDVRDVNDVGNFQDMSEAVFYSALASVITNVTASKTGFENNAARFLRVWFLDEQTRMNPKLNFGQMIRGPGGTPGAHTGVLDLKAMAKVASAILILRKNKAASWTTELDNAMISWSREYITWLETAEIAIEEGIAENNHGTFYYNQLAALKIIVNDLPGALNVTQTYFNTQFKSQIVASGEQPLEAARTRPYHYRAYNLAAMITNARLHKYADPTSDPFRFVSNAGTTIQSALDHAMNYKAADSGEPRYAAELYPNVAAVAAIYGDPDNKYLNYLKREDATFVMQPYVLFNQPFAANETAGLAPPDTKKGSSNSGSTGNTLKPGSASNSKDTSGAWATASCSNLASLVAIPFLLLLGSI